MEVRSVSISQISRFWSVLTGKKIEQRSDLRATSMIVGSSSTCRCMLVTWTVRQVWASVESLIRWEVTSNVSLLKKIISPWIWQYKPSHTVISPLKKEKLKVIPDFQVEVSFFPPMDVLCTKNALDICYQPKGPCKDPVKCTVAHHDYHWKSPEWSHVSCDVPCLNHPLGYRCISQRKFWGKSKLIFCLYLRKSVWNIWMGKKEHEIPTAANNGVV